MNDHEAQQKAMELALKAVCEMFKLVYNATSLETKAGVIAHQLNLPTLLQAQSELEQLQKDAGVSPHMPGAWTCPKCSFTPESPTWPYVLEFAARMEAKLAKNRHKGDRAGWLKDHPWDLVERILDETVEVQQCFTDKGNGPQVDDSEALANECADVANFCMMVADSALSRTLMPELFEKEEE